MVPDGQEGSPCASQDVIFDMGPTPRNGQGYLYALEQSRGNVLWAGVASLPPSTVAVFYRKNSVRSTFRPLRVTWHRCGTSDNGPGRSWYVCLVAHE